MRRQGNHFDPHELLEALARPEPTPAGGAAAALVVSQGAALGLMVVRIAFRREGQTSVATLLRDAEAALLRVYHDAWPLFEEDARAYDAVRQASSKRAAQSAENEETLQRALLHAVDVPLRIMDLAAHGLAALSAVSAFVSPALLVDAAAGARLMLSGAQISLWNIRHNALSLTDRDEARHRQERARQGWELADAAYEEIHTRLDARSAR